jgi:uncharacterized LabA/DUF88 family protein
VLYRYETGNTLTYEQVIDYLSQDFEDDGEIRIYYNGRHPEIYDYTVWRSNPMSVTKFEYHQRLQEIWSEYVQEIPNSPIWLLPVAVIDEIVIKAFDPDYELDLTNIINRYIADGRAVVSEDGRTIEFIVPES